MRRREGRAGLMSLAEYVRVAHVKKLRPAWCRKARASAPRPFHAANDSPPTASSRGIHIGFSTGRAASLRCKCLQIALLALAADMHVFDRPKKTGGSPCACLH